MRLDDPDSPLAVEIRKETAEAYFDACRKMVAALEVLKAFDRVMDSSTLNAGETSAGATGTVAVPQDQENVRQRFKLLDEAAERVHFVVIQRDAMKLRYSEQFFEDYGVPNEVRKRLGTRRQSE